MSMLLVTNHNNNTLHDFSEDVPRLDSGIGQTRLTVAPEVHSLGVELANS